MSDKATALTDRDKPEKMKDPTLLMWGLNEPFLKYEAQKVLLFFKKTVFPTPRAIIHGSVCCITYFIGVF
jgi:hypothetical protein